MHYLLIALAFVAVQPKAAEHVRIQSNARVRAGRQAEVPVPPQAPGASLSTQVPVNMSWVDSTGAKYTLTGVLTQTREDPPPPLIPTIAGVRATGGTAFVTEALSGAQLELVGAGLPTTGQLRLTVGDKTAMVRLWTPTLVQFTGPVVTAPFTGTVTLWVQVNNAWTVAARGPAFTLRPGSVEVPLLPRVDRFLAADGTAPAAFTINQPVTIVGVGFGPEKGWIMGPCQAPPLLPITFWSDTKIVTTAGDGITGRDPQGKPFPSHWAIKIVSGPFGLPQPLGWTSADGPPVVMR